MGTWEVMPRNEDIRVEWPTGEDSEIKTVEQHLANAQGTYAMQMPSTTVCPDHELNLSMEMPCTADCDEVGCGNRIDCESS